MAKYSPLEGWLVLGPHRFDDLDRFAKLADTHRSLGELVAVGEVLVLLPTGADGEFEAPAGDDVDRRGDLGHVRTGAGSCYRCTSGRAGLRSVDAAKAAMSVHAS